MTSFEENVSRSLVDFEEAMSEGLWENEIKAIGNWEKWSPCYVITISLATLSPELPWKVENVPIELCDITKEIIIQSAKGMVWFLLASYS